MSRKRSLHVRNWHRYLWLDMRSSERFYARERRWLAEQVHSPSSETPSHRNMVASCGRLLVAYIRGANQCRRLLGL